jgi:hypothetical protein
MKDEFMDEDLIGMVNFTDETAPQQMPVMEQKERPVVENACDAVPVADYVPLPKMQRGTMERLKHGAAWICVCGGIAMLMWWFWVNDLMAMEAAYPCILACGVIGAFGAGMNFRK